MPNLVTQRTFNPQTQAAIGSHQASQSSAVDSKSTKQSGVAQSYQSDSFVRNSGRGTANATQTQGAAASKADQWDKYGEMGPIFKQWDQGNKWLMGQLGSFIKNPIEHTKGVLGLDRLIK